MRFSEKGRTRKGPENFGQKIGFFCRGKDFSGKAEEKLGKAKEFLGKAEENLGLNTLPPGLFFLPPCQKK